MSTDSERMAQEKLQRFPDQVQHPEGETKGKTGDHFNHYRCTLQQSQRSEDT